MSFIQQKGYFKQHNHSAFSRVNKISQDRKDGKDNQGSINSQDSLSNESTKDTSELPNISRKQAFSYIKKLFHPCCE